MIPPKRTRLTRKVILTAIILSLLVSGSVLAYLYYIDNFPKRLSALEAKKVADRIASINHVTIPLTDIDPYDWAALQNVDERGRTTAWIFTYKMMDSPNGTLEEIGITVYADGKTNISDYSHRVSDNITVYPISRAIVDSTTAFRAAVESPVVNKYRSDHPSKYLQSFKAAFNSDYARIVWSVSWRDNGFMDDPTFCTAVIDASDGRVL